MGLITLHKWTKEDKPKTEKTCARCKKVKPLSEFSPHGRSTDGKASYCHSCCVDLQTERYKKIRKVKEGFFDPNERMF